MTHASPFLQNLFYVVSKGKAVFKLKITKKGKFKATIKFAGDKLYKASKKTVYIKIKK